MKLSIIQFTGVLAITYFLLISVAQFGDYKEGISITMQQNYLEQIK